MSNDTESQLLKARREKVDQILDQISKKGLGSLSKEDREFLKRASERLRTRERRSNGPQR